MPMYGMPSPGAMHDVTGSGTPAVADDSNPPILRTQSMQQVPVPVTASSALGTLAVMSWDMATDVFASPLTPAVAPLKGQRATQPLQAQVRRVTQAIEYYKPHVLVLQHVDSHRMALWLQRGLHSMGYELVRSEVRSEQRPTAPVTSAMVAWRRRALRLKGGIALPRSGFPAVALQHTCTQAVVAIAPCQALADTAGYGALGIEELAADGNALLALGEEARAQAVLWAGSCAGGPGSAAYDLLSQGVCGAAMLRLPYGKAPFQSVYQQVLSKEPMATSQAADGQHCRDFLWLRSASREGMTVNVQAVLAPPSRDALAAAGPMPNHFSPTRSISMHATLDVVFA